MNVLHDLMAAGVDGEPRRDLSRDFRREEFGMLLSDEIELPGRDCSSALEASAEDPGEYGSDRVSDPAEDGSQRSDEARKQAPELRSEARQKTRDTRAGLVLSSAVEKGIFACGEIVSSADGPSNDVSESFSAHVDRDDIERRGRRAVSLASADSGDWSSEDLRLDPAGEPREEFFDAGRRDLFIERREKRSEIRLPRSDELPELVLDAGDRRREGRKHVFAEVLSVESDLIEERARFIGERPDLERRGVPLLDDLVVGVVSGRVGEDR